MHRIQRLSTPASAEAAFAASQSVPVFLFKHSTACGVSARAQREFTAFLENAPEGFAFYQVDVLESRAASDRVEYLALVRHESPQALLLWGSECVWHASHGAIRAGVLREQAESLLGRPAQ